MGDSPHEPLRLGVIGLGRAFTLMLPTFTRHKLVRLVAAFERGIADGRLDVVTPEALQAVIAAACRLYTARREAGEEFMPVAKNSISATDVMVTASGLLRAADLAAFELGMWQTWSGR